MDRKSFFLESHLLKMAMTRKRLRAFEVAPLLGMSEGKFSKIANGRESLGLEKLKILASLCEVEPEFLVATEEATP